MALPPEASGEASRREDGETVLGKVPIKGESKSDTKPLHDGKADRICKGEILVRVAKEDVFGPFFVRGAGAHDGRVALRHVPEELHSGSGPKSGNQKGVRLDNENVPRPPIERARTLRSSTIMRSCVRQRLAGCDQESGPSSSCGA